MATMHTPAADLEVHVPKLSDEANAALEREMRAVLGDEHYHGGELPGPEHRLGDALLARPHNRLFAAAVDIRIMVVPISLMLLVVALIPAASSAGALLVLPFAALVVSVALVAELIASMTREVEHLSPEVAAILANEGIGDPDRLFGDLLADYRDSR